MKTIDVVSSACCRLSQRPLSITAKRQAWRCSIHLALLFAIAFVSVAACAAEVERGVLVREAQVYITPDTHSTKLSMLDRGLELAIMEKSSGGWIRVSPMTKSVSGWIQDKGLVRPTTPNGDQILYGEAVDSENEASQRGGRKGADKDAFRLYRMTAEDFPNSPLAGEALYRAADIRWQIDRADMLRRPSAKERDPFMRHQMDEELMREVTKKFPRTKWADLATFHLIENKLCGDWQGEPKCPEKEAELYEKYAAEHPQSPVVAEALYDASTRRAALIQIYKTKNEPAKSSDAKTRALALTQRIAGLQNVPTDWTARARALQYIVEQDIPTYGTVFESSGEGPGPTL